ncbi:MAG: CHAP domain-containing protein [Nocardioides sp.]
MTRLLRAACALLCLTVVSALGPVLTASPAEASVTILCRGYDGCKALGMGNGGYKANRGTMWWRMYSGHNCTNYAAYRMVKSGLPNVRPWSGSGNAMYWGEYLPQLTDPAPAVGAVAWWKANIKGASGSAGHVAYVEQVVSADEIIVSQDSWGGDFSWARITRSGDGWPSGFIHFNDVPLTNKEAPVATGTAKVGSQLTASPGTWSPSGITYTYQWRANGVDIADATSATLTLKKAQKGKRISVRTTASKLGYPTAVASSAETPPVEPGQIKSVTAPTVTGEATVDSPLVATSGTWTPEPATLGYQWTADGIPVDGATATTFTPGPDQVGKAIAVVVTASKSGYVDVPSTSAPTQPVAPGTITAFPTPLLSGAPRLGQTLTVDPGTFVPADAAVSLEWLRAGVPVEGATGPSYLLTPADLGSRLQARVTFTKPGYTTVQTRSTRSRLVKTVPVVKAAAAPAKGRVGLAVTVSAPGVDPVEGIVQVKHSGKVLKELTLRDGTATTTLRGPDAGKHTIKVKYVATRTVAGAALIREVRIR